MVDADSPDAPLTLAAGERLLDRYRVNESIGEGGYSRVYRAHDERLERDVCIKLFHRIRRDTTAYQRSYDQFVQEAFALSKLQHPSTLRIYDFGHVGDQGPPFHVTELADGGTLTARVRERGPLSREEAIPLVEGLCGALTEAHGLGIVHRDIKPGNILISTAGSTSVMKLADFGVAKALAESGDTGGGSRGEPRMYSRRWAAPEQMTSYPVTAASDLYSLALVVVYALTGRTAFRQSDPGAAYAERTASRERVGEILGEAEMPETAREVLARTCSFDPRQRPASAEELARELADALRAPGAAPAPASVPAGARAAENPTPKRPPLRPRLSLSAPEARVGDRVLRLLPAHGGEAELEVEPGLRLHVALVPAGNDGFCTHIKAMGGFVRRRGGRPSRAVQLVEPGEAGEIEIVAPNGTPLLSARVALSWREESDVVLSTGELEIAASAGTCLCAILVDFGERARAALVFLPSVSGSSPSACP